MQSVYQCASNKAGEEQIQGCVRWPAARHGQGKVGAGQASAEAWIEKRDLQQLPVPRRGSTNAPEADRAG